MADMTRRRFLGAMLAVAAAPMIVRASSLMAHVPVRPNPSVGEAMATDFPSEALRYTMIGRDYYGRAISEDFVIGSDEGFFVTRVKFAMVDSIVVAT